MRGYLKFVLLWMTACLLAVVAFNVAIDPYWVFDTPQVSGVNAIKSRAGQREQLVKQYRIHSLRPNAIILGNSRAQVGFDPQHGAWHVRPVLNLAVPGAGPQAARRLFAQAASVRPPKLVVLGLDFVDFRLDPGSAPKTNGLKAVELPSLPSRLQDYVSVTLSVDALVDSMLTVSAQYEAYPTSLTALGFNPMHDYIVYARREGYGSLFLQRDQENAKRYLRGGKEIIDPATGTSPELESIRDILRQAGSSHTEVHLVIYPYHAHLLELFDLAGLWDAFEDWKRDLAELVESERRASGTKMLLWDFSGYNAFTTETVPDVTDTTANVQWYWEAGHFKKELGDIVLDRVLGSPQIRSGSMDFGILISPSNIERHLQSIRAGRTKYRREHQAEVADLARLVERLVESSPQTANRPR